MKRFSCLILFFILSVQFVSAQDDKRFTTNSEQLMEELEKMYTPYDKKSAKSLVSDFQKAWGSGVYGEKEQEKIVEWFNYMDSNSVRVFPDISNYTEALINFANTKQPQSRFANWHEVLDKLTAGKLDKKVLANFLEFSRYLFRDRTLYESKSGSVKWQSSSENYQFEYDQQPYLTFSNMVLKCYAKRDSAIIDGTKGVYYPLEHDWKGEGGKVYWTRAKYDENKLFASLSDYSLDTRKASFGADSVLFTNKQYFTQPLLGKLEEKIIADVSEDRVSYPRFESYKKRIVIKNIVKDVDYDGGFAQHGVKFLGAGSKEEPSKIVVHYENKPFIIASAQRFIINLNEDIKVSEEEKSKRKKENTENENEANRIVSSSAYIEIALDTDTIIHPGLTFKLFTDTREVNLIRTDEGLDQAPYIDLYHQLEMDFELMTWEIGKPRIEFKSYDMSTDKIAYFTSTAYYTQREFDQLMGNADRHPLSLIKQCVDQHGRDELTINELAQCIQLPPSAIEAMLLRYTYMGYMSYSTETKKAKIQGKLSHHVLARSKKADYDVINIVSDASNTKGGINATLNLLNYELTIQGVDRVVLNRQHRVAVFPSEKRIVVSKNRDFTCDGVYAAGKFEFFGKSYSFSYDEFKVDMPIIDSVQLWSNSTKKDERGNYMEQRVLTKLEGLKGELLIDISENKSGRFDIPKFPIFTSEQESYAYYDKKEILGGVYPRNSFYFQIKPFEFDSLDKYTNDQIQFDGTFVSADIFPDFEETLRLQEDNSLGFIRNTPSGGFPAYKGKGTYENEIRLSHKGLRGDGTLNYLTATAEADNFYFFPDSVNVKTSAFAIEEQMSPVEYPTVNGKEVYVHWMPYLDDMQVNTIQGSDPLDMFAGVSKHEGQLNYTPTGLSGSGQNTFEGAKLTSNHMDFKFYEIFSDTADFELSTDTLFQTVAFSTKGINAHINFKERVAKCHSNGKPTLTTFEQIQYEAYLSKFTWYMDSDEVEFSSEGETVDQGTESIELEGAKFTSIHPQQDSLSWYAKAATYNLTQNKIDAKEVKFVDVGDARVFPNGEKLTVLKGAEMVPLDSAKIVANRQLKYHEIYDAHVDINGLWNYNANGKYDYIDENKRIQTLVMEEITLDTSRQTYATGKVLPEDGFMLSPAFAYQGKFRMEANQKSLYFNGYGQLNHTCEMMQPTWFRLVSQVDPNDVVIEIEEPTDMSNQPVWSTLIVPRDSSLLYSTFLTKPETKGDHQVCQASGFLVYDKPTKEYRISSFEKLNERSLPGNYVSLNTGTCIVEGEGKLNIVRNPGVITIQPVGKYSHNTINNEVTMEMTMLVDFLFDKKSLGIMQKAIVEMEGLAATDIDGAVYETALREFLGTEKADEMIGKLSLGKNVKVPEELEKTMFFSNINMKWNPDKEVFQSVGPIGISNFGNDQVNRYVDGHIVVENTRTGVEIDIYLEASGGTWFIFNYKASTGYMRIFSSVEEFNLAVDEVKRDDTKLKVKGQRPYVFMKGTKRLKSDLMKKVDDIE